jgi:hypothetical protein
MALDTEEREEPRNMAFYRELCDAGTIKARDSRSNITGL